MRAVAVVAVLLLAGCTSSGGDPRGSAPVTAPSAGPVTTTRTPPPTSSAGSATGSATGGPTGTATLPADWPMYHGDPARTGVAASMPTASGPLHRIATLELDGQVYASPIVVGGTTIVATENNTVYAFDGHYRQVWKRHLGSPSPASERPCGNIDPLGITGTPVYDAGTRRIFVAPEFSGSPPRHELLALDARTGSITWRRSLDLPGVDASAMQERGALALTGGRVWVPFGGLAGDCGAYKGRVIGYRVDGTGAPVAYTVPTAREAGIWTPPGPVVDAAGTLYVSVGNGESGVGDRYDHSDSVLKLSPDARLIDSFSPRSWATDNEGDLDLGSQAPALVGPWVFIAGKSGTAYVLRRDHLGGIGGEVSSAGVCRSFGGTAVVGDVVYVPCLDGVRAVRVDGSGRIHVLWHADGAISGSPVVGGARVWALDPNGGVLHALDPATGRSRAAVRVGATSRFATPAISGSHLIVPTLTGITVVSAGQ
jgi:outer membrane protein assembly factor BamB